MRDQSMLLMSDIIDAEVDRATLMDFTGYFEALLV